VNGTVRAGANCRGALRHARINGGFAQARTRRGVSGACATLCCSAVFFAAARILLLYSRWRLNRVPSTNDGMNNGRLVASS